MVSYKIIFVVNLISILISTIQCAPMNKEEGKEYLKKFGYMQNDTTNEIDFEKSLKEYQDVFSLPVTGQLGTETTEQMGKPRCGHPDIFKIKKTEIIWTKKKLTYKLKNYPQNDLSAKAARTEIKRAFKLWEEQIPLEFEEKSEGTQVDIDIKFSLVGDGPGNTLAYAFFPKIGDIYFDNEEWTEHSNRGYNLFTVAAHEIGHSLGLEHSRNKRALLYPHIGPYNPDLRLHSDDITRIQDLYGKRESTPPNICDLNKIDSAVFSNEAVYLIKDNYCWKIKNNKVQSGFPKGINEVWIGSPVSVDAAYSYGDNIYFHDGKDILKYDMKKKKTENTKRVITNIDAGVTYEERLYIFQGSKYWRYDNMVLNSDYPRSISSFWTGVPNSIDAVYYENASPFKYFYFFKGSKVYKFNSENRSMVKEMSFREYLSC